MRRKDPGHMVVSATLEDEPVEHAVQQVAQRPREDEPGTDDEPAMIFLLDDGPNVVNAEHNRYQPEQRQRHLAPGAAELPAPGHTFILHKIDLRLVAQQLDAI